MKIVSIDLSTHQVGITIQENEHITTLTIKDILEQSKFQLLDLSLIKRAVDHLLTIIPAETDYVLIE
jgi:RNase H-fold protein (predicted Holliday junction resolvase)